MPPTDLSIVIVSWNVWPLLGACLRSIERASRPASVTGASERVLRGATSDGRQAQTHTLEVIVVDNASSDGTAAQVRAVFPWVQVIASEKNLGFTRANNLGYAQSGGRFVYFLNPDTELVGGPVQGDSLDILFNAVASDETVAVAGPALHYADNSPQSSRRRFPTPITGFVESTWLGRMWPNNRWARRYRWDDWPVDYAHDVDWVVGAAMLCRRAALEEVIEGDARGPFDEGFFMYAEEMDLCRRVKARGGRVLYVPSAHVVHYEGRSSEQAVAARHVHFNMSKVRYWRKWFGPRWSEALRRYLLLEYRVQIGIERAKWLLGSKRALRKQRIAAYREVIASGLREGESTISN